MKKVICFLSILFMLSGCVVNKAKYASKSTVNANNAVISINGATLKKGKSILGISAQIISAGVGGYLGYKYLPVVLGYKNDVPNLSAAGAAAVGAVAGYGINNSVNYLMGERKAAAVGSTNYEKWAKKFDPWNRYAKVSSGQYELVFVKKQEEKDFIIKNYEDAFYFSKAFPDSKYINEKIGQSLEAVPWNQYMNLASLFPKKEYALKILTAYFEQSTSASDLIEAINRFPVFKTEAEPFLFRLIQSKNDVKYFLNAYPNSQFSNQVFAKILNTKNIFSNLSKDDLRNLFENFPDFKQQAEESLFGTISSKGDIYFFNQNYSTSINKNKILQKILFEEKIFNEYDRSELSNLIEEYKITDSVYVNKIENRRISLATSFFDVKQDLVSYSDKKNLIEDRAIEFVKDYVSWDKFYDLFYDGKYFHLYSDEEFGPIKGAYIGKYWDTTNDRPADYKFGILKASGQKYMGIFLNGKKHGKGIYDGNLGLENTEIHYEGEFKNGKLNGEGHYIDKVREYAIDYKGELKDNLMDGKGAATGNLGNGQYTRFGFGQSSYSGTWKKGKADGEGKYVHGEYWYEGGFKEGGMHGYGTLRLPNGIRITGPWKDHAPNGRMHFYKYILMGLIRDDYYQEAYSMKDLGTAEGNFIVDMSRNDAQASRKQEIEKEQAKIEREAERKIEQSKRDEKKVRECMSSVNSALKEIATTENGWLSLDCPCIYYNDPSFFGYRLELKVDKKDRWFYIVKGWIFDDTEGPFVSKGDAIRGVCEKWHKSKE